MNPLIIVLGILIAVASALIGMALAWLFKRDRQSDLGYPFYDEA